MLSPELKDARCQVVIDKLSRVEVLGESGVLFSASCTGWSPPENGQSQVVLTTTGSRDGVPVEYVGFDMNGSPVCRGTCGPQGSGADWEFSRPQVQAGAPITCTWSHTEP